MAETDTVVARLRDPWKHSEELCTEAATELARLQAENEALRRERDEARFSPIGDNHHNALKCPYCNPGWVEQVAAREAAEAKAARLEETLAWMRDRDDRNGSLPQAFRDKLDAALEA